MFFRCFKTKQVYNFLFLVGNRICLLLSKCKAKMKNRGFNNEKKQEKRASGSNQPLFEKREKEELRKPATFLGPGK